jgi:BirA family transcriptional regulator, biotin operon repressor / biotin---[acetyl-CoA-carboxylase] ligase
MTVQADTAILNLLASSSGYLSGQAIARHLALSRTAVWKRVNYLKKIGCTFDSSSNRGYRLLSTPDKPLPPLVQMGLQTARIGREVFFYQEVDSTNLKAKELATQGVPDGSVVIAEYQSRGQGRLQRKWLSPAGKNLLFTIIFYPPSPPPKVFQLTLLASLAVCKSIINQTGLAAGIKWPNDVYVGNRKICGVLTEFTPQGEGVKWAVVGIGLNVNFDPAANEEVSAIATSIRNELGRPQHRLYVLKSILEEMDRLYTHFLSGTMAPVREEWLAHSVILGKPVTITSYDHQEDGIAESIDEDGALILLTPKGAKKKIVFGDLSLRVKA